VLTREHYLFPVLCSGTFGSCKLRINFPTKDLEDTLYFSALTNISPTIETFPLEDANEAYDRMINNEARFRVVLEM
jgi:D-arabinose 1-dehydrogenase-like Zn-dependent alcohol dehydrogenase